MFRVKCGKANTYNVEQFEKMREGAMTESQESNGRDNSAAHDDGADSANG